MKKLIISVAVDLHPDVFAQLCMHCGGYYKIPGTDMSQLPEFASDKLAKVLELGMQSINSASQSLVGAEVNNPLHSGGMTNPSTMKSTVASTEAQPAIPEPPQAEPVAEASSDPVARNRMLQQLGNAAGLRGMRKGFRK